jgi:hypothetical protein
LFVDGFGGKVEPFDGLIIDEKFWKSGLHGDDKKVWFVLPRLLSDRTVPTVEDGKVDHGTPDQERTLFLMDISRRVHAVIAKHGPSLAALRDAGITRAELRKAKACEYDRKRLPTITPGMPYERQKRIISGAMSSECGRLGRFWRLLEEQLDREDLDTMWGMRLERDVKNMEGQLEDRIYMCWSNDISSRFTNIPTLLIDADLDAEIVRRFLPDLQDPLEIEFEWSPYVQVIQAGDVQAFKSRYVEKIGIVKLAAGWVA